MVAAVPGDSLGVCSQKPTQFQRAARAAAGGNTGGTLTTPLGQADGRQKGVEASGYGICRVQEAFSPCPVLSTWVVTMPALPPVLPSETEVRKGSVCRLLPPGRSSLPTKSVI